MGRKKTDATPTTTLTAPRAARLHKLLTLLGEGPQTRRQLLTRLRLDIRGFYRDLEALRGLGIEVTAVVGNKYALAGELEAIAAVARAFAKFFQPGGARLGLACRRRIADLNRRARQFFTMHTVQPLPLGP